MKEFLLNKAKKEALNYFLAGLNEPPEYRVRELNPINLTDAISKAVVLARSYKSKQCALGNNNNNYNNNTNKNARSWDRFPFPRKNVFQASVDPN